jgi:SAM-dependent methyltransferase
VRAVIGRPLKKLWQKAIGADPWDETGKPQFEYLVKEGLTPEHYLLDVGCGALRGGIHFIRYLEAGHYVGVDKNKKELDRGRNVKLRKYRLRDKRPVLVEMADFDFPSLDQSFDYALAQSVFTHLPLNGILRCVLKIDKVLVPGGRFYATFYENPEGRFNLRPMVRAKVGRPDILTYFDRDPYHYDFATFRWISEGTALTVEYLGSWGHPRDQKMMVFIKS